MEEWDPQEKAFHSAVREYVVCLLLFLAVYILSYAAIRRFKKRTSTDELCAGDPEDFLVYRISVWICTFSLSVSAGAVSLLPFSVLANEILLRYPNSYYIQWLNTSLIHSLWTYVFMASNLSVFILLPFAYFFIESQGFSGLKKGIMTRVYESLALCSLSLVVIVCLAHLAFILLDEERSRTQSLLNIWNYQLPFIYSCVSLFGVLTLLICTPLGIARMFTVVSDLVMKPKQKRNLETELMVAALEERSLQRKLDGLKSAEQNGHHASLALHLTCNGLRNGQRNGQTAEGVEGLLVRIRTLAAHRLRLEQQKRALWWMANLKYPVVMLLLLALTAVCVLMVVNNTFQLLVGFRSLPSYRQFMEIGSSSLSTFGLAGAWVEIVEIPYLMLASVVGLYSVPGLRRIRPRPGATSMTQVIGNCFAVLILSSALPVLARTLGITDFDLLGLYGKIDWLGNFYLVWSYNLVFAVATGLCLVTTFTASLRRELCHRFNEARLRLRYRRLSSDGLFLEDHSKSV